MMNWQLTGTVNARLRRCMSETVFRTSSGLVIRTVLKLRDDEEDFSEKIKEARTQRRRLKEKIRLRDPVKRKAKLERTRKWRAKNKETVKEYRAKWVEKNRDKLRAQLNRYREKHLEERKAYLRWYYENVRKPRERPEPRQD